MRRAAVSPAQRAEMRGDISGSDALPESERTVRENSMAENEWPCPDARGGALGDPRDKAKAGLLESHAPERVIEHPLERHAANGAVPCDGTIYGARRNPPGQDTRGR